MSWKDASELDLHLQAASVLILRKSYTGKLLALASLRGNCVLVQTAAGSQSAGTITVPVMMLSSSPKDATRIIKIRLESSMIYVRSCRFSCASAQREGYSASSGAGDRRDTWRNYRGAESEQVRLLDY